MIFLQFLAFLVISYLRSLKKKKLLKYDKLIDHNDLNRVWCVLEKEQKEKQGSPLGF